MDARYRIEQPGEILSPGLVVFRDIVSENLGRMVAMAGDPRRLCPHCKTHKMAPVIHLELERGIVRHKCATVAEAEMLAQAGVRDVFLAYNPVGPNVARVITFRQRYPAVDLAVQVDHERTLTTLVSALEGSRDTVAVYLDLDVGMGRTGVVPGPSARALYERICRTPCLRPAGLHVYDGHLHQPVRAERAAAVGRVWERVAALRDELQASGLPVNRIVAGGTGTFPLWAEIADPSLLLSPGTCVLQDAGYQAGFPDLTFVPAALLLTRVVSHPAADRITLDLGTKAVASDPPAGRRVVLPDLPDARIVVHNEEHLVVETRRASRYQPGDALLAVPWHVCPTSALHQEVFVVVEGQVVARWPVAARDRRLTI